MIAFEGEYGDTAGLYDCVVGIFEFKIGPTAGWELPKSGDD